MQSADLVAIIGALAAAIVLILKTIQSLRLDLVARADSQDAQLKEIGHATNHNLDVLRAENQRLIIEMRQQSEAAAGLIATDTAARFLAMEKRIDEVLSSLKLAARPMDQGR